MRGRNLLIGIIVLIIVAVAAAILASNKKTDTGSMNMPETSNNSNSSNNNNSSQPVETNTVKIDNFAFTPDSIKVKVGQTVTWTNEDSVAHTITADTASSDAPASNLLNNGQSYSFTFNKAGTYTYHCQVHPNMHGTVIVE